MAGSRLVVRAEIRRLREELGRLPSEVRDVPAKQRALEVQRVVDGLEAIADGVRRDRARARRAVTCLESETAGFEKALLLVSTVEHADRRARLERRLGERRSRLESARHDLERLDARLAEAESGITDAESDLADALTGWLSEAQASWVASGRRASLGGVPATAGRPSAPMGTRRTSPGPAVVAAASPEMWSPTAVLGYRAWAVARDGLTGAWRTWPSSRMTATCSAGGDLPHTDGRCARVAFGCGIYAATSPFDLVKEVGVSEGLSYAIGLVGLEGKVVQHERGYRAEHATVLALAVVDATHTRVETFDDPSAVADFFASKGREFVRSSPLTPGSTAWERLTGIVAYLKERAGRYETWTSASRSA